MVMIIMSIGIYDTLRVSERQVGRVTVHQRVNIVRIEKIRNTGDHG